MMHDRKYLVFISTAFREQKKRKLENISEVYKIKKEEIVEGREREKWLRGDERR